MKADIDVADIGKQITVSFKLIGVKRFTLRLRLTMLILRFAAWVAPINFRFE